MQQSLFMLRCPSSRYFGYNRRGIVFTFKSKRQAEYVRSHLKYDGNHVERIVANKYYLRTPYNAENSFHNCKQWDKQDLVLERKRMYDFVLSCNVNRVSLRIVNSILDLDNGDIELNVDILRYRMMVDEEITRFNLEMMYYQT